MNERAKDIMGVWGVNGVVVGVGWATANGALTALSILISIAYTIWKWRRDAKKK